MSVFSTPLTLVLMTGVADFRSEEDGSLLFPYPHCLDVEINPILYFYSHVRELFLGGIYSEELCPILKDVVNYIFTAYANHDKDVSRENWMYDKSFYLDYKGQYKNYELLKEKLFELVEFPDSLT